MRKVITAIVVFWSPQVLVAQTAEDKQRLSKLQEEAVNAYNKKQYDKALGAFQKMYEIDPNPLLLYNIGKCQESLGQKREALTSYQEFLQKVPATDKNYEKVKTSADALSAELGPAPAPGSPKEKFSPLKLKPAAYYGTSLGLAAVGTVFGVVSLSNAIALRDRGEDGTLGDSSLLARRMRLSAVVSDISFVLAAGSAFYGYQRAQKNERKVSFSIAPSSVNLSLEF